MAQRYFMFTLVGMAFTGAGALYLYAYSLGGRRARLVLSLGLLEIPHLVGDFFWLFWRGRHAARRGPSVSPVFADLAGAEGATEAGLRVPVKVSEYQAAVDEEARILAGFARITAELEASPDWLEAFHEETAASPVYRAWVLERTDALTGEQIRRALAAGRELVHASPGA